jgi:hypothetical protein
MARLSDFNFDAMYIDWPDTMLAAPSANVRSVVAEVNK